MKRILLKAVLTVGLISLIFHSIGCSNSNRANSSENEVKFLTYSQQERKIYIQNYLKNNYGLTCEVSEVKKRQNNVFTSEDYYYATAKTNDQDIISIWISENGEITDSVFLLNLQEEISNYYKSVIDKYYSKYKVRVYSELVEKPQKTQIELGEIEKFLREEPVFSSVRIYIGNTEDAEKINYEELASNLNFCDAFIYIYVCDSLDDSDIDNLSLSSYKYAKKIKKGE